MTPEAVIRRVMWKEGLRYRKDYGREHVQFAFIRPKIAVFITETGAEGEYDKDLTDKGWVVLRYKSGDITDGKDQIDEIRSMYKRNLDGSKIIDEEE